MFSRERDRQIALAFDVDHDPDADDAMEFDQVIQLPPPLVGRVETLLWQRAETNRRLGLPPTSRPELLIRSVRSALVAAGLGQKVSPPALIIGTILAAAKAEGLKPRTDLREMAKDLGVRYSTLLTVRRIALAQIGRLGVRLGIAIE